MGTMTMIGLGVVGLCGLVIVALLMRAMPRATFATWSLVMFFIPVWIGVTIGNHLFLSAITIITAIAIVALGKWVQFSIADVFMAVLVVIVVFQYAIGVVNLSFTAITVVEWLLPYAWGRLTLSIVRPGFVIKCISVCALITSALAVFEFITRINIFVLMKANNDLYTTWGTLMTRVDYVRSEGAWGHPIALGAALAMCSGFILATPWKPVVRVLGAILIAAGAVVTLSRTGMYTLVLTVVLTIVLLPNIGRTTRVATVALGCVGALVSIPLVGSIFTEEGQTATDSADYRGQLLSFFTYVKPFGSAEDFTGVTIGGRYLGFYSQSIDNAYLLTGLRLGWFALGAFCLVLACALIPLFIRGRSTPAVIAMAGQIPGLFTVALITQFGMFFWFMAGLAIAWDQLLRRDGSELDPAHLLNDPPLPATIPRHASYGR